MSNGAVLEDDNGKPVQALYDATGHQIVAAQAGTVSTDATTGAKYAAQSVIDLLNGAVPSIANPYPSADQIRLWILNGQGFSATPGNLTGTVAGIFGALQLFNASTAKNIFIYSLRVSGNNSTIGTLQYQYTTALDANMTNNVAPQNAKLGGPASVVTGANCSSSPASSGTAITATGVTADIQNGAPTPVIEFLSNGAGILLPAGANNGVAVYITITASEKYTCNMKWVEF